MLIPGARAHDYGRQEPETLFAAIAADGWQTLQLAFKKALAGVQSAVDITPLMVGRVDAALRANRLQLGVLGAYVEPSLADEAERARQVAEFCAQIPVAKALGAGCIGTETTNMQKQPGIMRDEALRQLRRSMEEILPVAQQHGVTVAVEPVYYHAMATPEDVQALLRDMQSPWLKVIFDPVNLLAPALAGDQPALWQRSFDCFGSQIVAVHIKGIKQAADGALVACPLEESIIDYEAVFAGLRPLTGSIPVLREEVKPAHARQDAAFMQALMRL